MPELGCRSAPASTPAPGASRLEPVSRADNGLCPPCPSGERRRPLLDPFAAPKAVPHVRGVERWPAPCKLTSVLLSSGEVASVRAEKGSASPFGVSSSGHFLTVSLSPSRDRDDLFSPCPFRPWPPLDGRTLGAAAQPGPPLPHGLTFVWRVVGGQFFTFPLTTLSRLPRFPAFCCRWLDSVTAQRRVASGGAGGSAERETRRPPFRRPGREWTPRAWCLPMR